MPLVVLANRGEAAAAKQGRVADPAFRTSVTIIVQDA
jgi:hypothetical protein